MAARVVRPSSTTTAQTASPVRSLSPREPPAADLGQPEDGAAQEQDLDRWQRPRDRQQLGRSSNSTSLVTPVKPDATNTGVLAGTILKLWTGGLGLQWAPRSLVEIHQIAGCNMLSMAQPISG